MFLEGFDAGGTSGLSKIGQKGTARRSKPESGRKSLMKSCRCAITWKASAPNPKERHM